MQLYLDEFSLPLYRAAKRAIDDWLLNKAEGREPVDKHFEVKLNFFFSDFVRWCFFAMRLDQTLERFSTWSVNPMARRAANPWEFAASLHWWLRQVRLHAGFYRFIKTKKAGLGITSRPDEALAQALDEAARPAVAAGGLSTEEQMQRAIMNCCKWESGTEIASSKMREWCWPQFRNRALAKFSEKVLTAMDELAKMGLLTTTNDKKHGRGHLLRQFKKKS